MKGLVVDASITANWLLMEEVSPAAEWTLQQMQNGAKLWAPALWLLEMANLLFKLERRKKIDRRYREKAFEELDQLPVSIFPSPNLKELKILRVYAEKYQLTPYDAEYLRLAQKHDLMLATLDGNLLAAAKREKVPTA